MMDASRTVAGGRRQMGHGFDVRIIAAVALCAFSAWSAAEPIAPSLRAISTLLGMALLVACVRMRDRGKTEQRKPRDRARPLIGPALGAVEPGRAAKRQERTEQLALLADHVPDAIILIGLNGVCRYASPSAARLFRTRTSQLVGKPLLDRLHPDDEQPARRAFADLSKNRSGKTIICFRAEKNGLPGVYTWLEAHCGVVRSAGEDGVCEIIASIRDIGRSKALERELRSAREQAETITAAKSAFLANMSHEIRTPMNGVIGFTELALASDLTPDLRRQISMIAESGRAMMRLLNDLLDMAKIEGGMMSITPEPIDLRHRLGACIRLMEPVAHGKGLALDLTLDPALPSWIECDPLRIRQVVLNLIGNALKFTDRGGVSVEVTVGDGCLFVAVIDSGIGIPADRLDHVFGQFTQADDTIARRYGGSGLGLAISRQLAQLMGGDLAVESVEGQGSTFLLTLPLVSAPVPTLLPEEPSAHQAATQPIGRIRILVAEDHDINQELIRNMACKAGYAVEIAEDGAEAIAMVLAAERQGRPFDLVLMDVQMPVVDGHEATRRMRSAGFTPERLPIVAITANAFAEDAAACLAAGMQDSLAKPLRMRDLVAAIRRWGPGDERALPAQSEAPLPAALFRRFAARKQEVATIITDALGQDGEDAIAIADIADRLHKIAGIAASFGEGDLGERSAKLETALRRREFVDVKATLEQALQLLSA